MAGSIFASTMAFSAAYNRIQANTLSSSGHSSMDFGPVGNWPEDTIVGMLLTSFARTKHESRAAQTDAPRRTHPLANNASMALQVRKRTKGSTTATNLSGGHAQQRTIPM